MGNDNRVKETNFEKINLLEIIMKKEIKRVLMGTTVASTYSRKSLVKIQTD